MVNKIDWTKDAELLEAQVYDGLLELIYGRASCERVVGLIPKLLSGRIQYAWKHLSPDTFKSACEYLMAHKEPYERMQCAPPDVVDIDNIEECQDADDWIIPEFDKIDNPLEVTNNYFAERVPAVPRLMVPIRVVTTGLRKTQYFKNESTEYIGGDGSKYYSFPYKNAQLCEPDPDPAVGPDQHWYVRFCTTRYKSSVPEHLLSLRCPERWFMALRPSAAWLIEHKGHG